MMSELLFQNNEIIFKNGDGELFLCVFSPCIALTPSICLSIIASVHHTHTHTHTHKAENALAEHAAYFTLSL